MPAYLLNITKLVVVSGTRIFADGLHRIWFDLTVHTNERLSKSRGIFIHVDFNWISSTTRYRKNVNNQKCSLVKSSFENGSTLQLKYSIVHEIIWKCLSKVENQLFKWYSNKIVFTKKKKLLFIYTFNCVQLASIFCIRVPWIWRICMWKMKNIVHFYPIFIQMEHYYFQTEYQVSILYRVRPWHA